MQAVGLSFTVSTLALACRLAGVDAFAPGLVLPSLLAVVVSLAGMRLGQAVARQVAAQAFRLCFFFGLLVLGAYLALRGSAERPMDGRRGPAVPSRNRLHPSVSMTVPPSRSRTSPPSCEGLPEEWQARVDLAAAYG